MLVSIKKHERKKILAYYYGPNNGSGAVWARFRCGGHFGGGVRHSVVSIQ